MKHILKILPCYFEAVLDGKKTFEIRENDRGYQAGDTVVLREHDKVMLYTGRELEFKIGYVLNFAQKENWVVFSLLPL